VLHLEAFTLFPFMAASLAKQIRAAVDHEGAVSRTLRASTVDERACGWIVLISHAAFAPYRS
jgi:hypothetical protein